MALDTDIFKQSLEVRAKRLRRGVRAHGVASLTRHRRKSPPAPGSGPSRRARSLTRAGHTNQTKTLTTKNNDRLKKQTNEHGLPPSAGFWNVTGYDGAERLRKLVVWSSSRLPVRAHSVQIEEK